MHSHHVFTHPRRRPSGRRLLIAAAGAVTIIAMSATPALAHISVSSPDAQSGGFGKLVFRVPNESDTAGTVKLAVQLPAGTPFAFVSAKPLAGWTVESTTTKLDAPVTVSDFNLTEAVTKVTWTATGTAQIGPGEFDEFELSVGPFSDTAEALAFPTTQTYSDGTVVSWDQPQKAGAAEPEHPTPTLSLTAPDQGADPSAPTARVVRQETMTASASDTSDDTLARWLGGLGLGLGIVALGLATLRRRA